MHALIKKHVVYLIIASLVLVASVLGLWRFGVSMHVRIEKVIVAKSALVSYEENKKIYAEESAALARIGARAARLETYRITTQTTPQLLSSLEDLARQYGLEFAITAVQTPGTTGSQKLVVDFSAKSTAPAIDAFLVALSQQTYQVKFNTFSLFAEVPPAPDPTRPVVSRVPGWELLASIEILSF